jgi:hypothetical protein
MNQRTLQEIAAIEDEMHQRLANIPLARCNPYSQAVILENELSSLEKTIKRLKTFIAFLRKLNPVQYIEWFKEAYASYVPTKQNAKAKTSVAPATATHQPVASTPPTMALPKPQKPK